MVATADNPLTRHQLHNLALLRHQLFNLALPRHQLFNLALPRHQLLNLALGKHQLPNLALRPQVHVVAMLTSVVPLLVVTVVDIVTFLGQSQECKTLELYA